MRIQKAIWATLLFFGIGFSSANDGLKNVTSWVYSSGATAATPGYSDLIKNSPIQMFVIGYPGDTSDPIYSRNKLDPAHAKIILGGIDVAEGSEAAQPSLFTNGQPPSWFGGKYPAGAWYSVQYWNPAWKAVLFREIDELIAQGYDGAFLDVLYGDNEWVDGNVYGNSPYPNAKQAMVTLFGDIVSYVKSKNLDHFYLLGANPAGISDVNPQILSSLDGIFFDGIFYISNGNGSTASSVGLNWFAQYSPIYQGLGLPIFANDYPPVGDFSAAMQAFSYGESKGWITTIDPGNEGGDQYLKTGPFLFYGAGLSSNIKGSNSGVNLISGGALKQATLTAGSRGDYIFGSAGSNIINGGDGNDLIYAHPASATLKGMLTLNLFAHNSTSTIPRIQVAINGKVAVPPTPITVLDTSGQTQQITIDLTPFYPIQSLVISETGISYTNSNNFSNIRLLQPTYGRTPISFNLASFSGQSVALQNGSLAELDTGGVITFPGAAFQVSDGFFSDNKDVIDGGAGVNSVVYRSNYRNYAITSQGNGEWLVSSATTAEGPDTLKNIQNLQFADVTIPLSNALPLAADCVFSYAQGNFPSLFNGLPTKGSYMQYTYAYFPISRNYLGIDQTSGIWMLGPDTNGQLLFIGVESAFSKSISTWASLHSGTGC